MNPRLYAFGKVIYAIDIFLFSNNKKALMV